MTSSPATGMYSPSTLEKIIMHLEPQRGRMKTLEASAYCRYAYSDMWINRFSDPSSGITNPWPLVLQNSLILPVSTGV